MLVLSGEIWAKPVAFSDKTTMYADCGVSGGLEFEVIVSATVALGEYCTVEEANPSVMMGAGAGLMVRVALVVPLG